MKKPKSKDINTIREFIATNKEIEALKLELKDLEKRRVVLQGELLPIIDSEYEYLGFSLSKKSRRKYGDWPSDVLKKEEELKNLKAESKRVGNVDYEITEYISIKENASSV